MIELRAAKNVSYREVFYEIRVFAGENPSTLQNSGTINLYPKDWEILRKLLITSHDIIVKVEES